MAINKRLIRTNDSGGGGGSFVGCFPTQAANDHFFISPDGLRCIMSTTAGNIRRYSMSTAWDISTLTFNNNQISYTSGIVGMYYCDNSNVFIASSSNQRLYSYTFSSGFNPSPRNETGDFSSSIWLSAKNISTTSSYIYVVGGGNIRRIIKSSCDADLLSTTGMQTVSNSFCSNGFIVGNSGLSAFGCDGSNLHRFTLSTPYDLTTLTKTPDETDVTNCGTGLKLNGMKPDGTKIYVLATNGNIGEYNTSFA